MDYEVYIYHPCLLDRARNSQPCSSCGRTSVPSPLPFGLRNPPADKCSTCSCGTCTADPYHVIPCFQGSGPAMYRRPRSSHTLSSCPWAGRRDLVYGFSVELALRQVGTCAPLSPSPGLSQRAETALLNKSVEISVTTGRFCSRRHLCVCGFAC